MRKVIISPSLLCVIYIYVCYHAECIFLCRLVYPPLLVGRSAKYEHMTQNLSVRQKTLGTTAALTSLCWSECVWWSSRSQLSECLDKGMLRTTSWYILNGWSKYMKDLDWTKVEIVKREESYNRVTTTGHKTVGLWGCSFSEQPPEAALVSNAHHWCGEQEADRILHKHQNHNF